jgi:predicted peroxiredoxin
MKLGILVNTDRHAEDITGIASAVAGKGHEVIIFFMDEGVRLLHDPGVADLCRLEGVSMSFCDYTTERLGLSKEGISEDIACGSQYNNSMMNHEADRVIVL